jgi:hypothetical protein
LGLWIPMVHGGHKSKLFSWFGVHFDISGDISNPQRSRDPLNTIFWTKFCLQLYETNYFSAYCQQQHKMHEIRTKKSHSCLNPFSLQQLITVVAKFRFNKHFNSVKTQVSNQKRITATCPQGPFILSPILSFSFVN